MTNNKETSPREADLALAKTLVRDWLMEKGIALTGVNGEASKSTIHRFKLELASRILTALTTTRLEAVRDSQREAAEFFCHWLLRAYETIHRDTSYEEGENLDSIARELNQVIGFAGYEPESEARARLLAKKFSWNELHIEAEGSGE